MNGRAAWRRQLASDSYQRRYRTIGDSVTSAGSRKYVRRRQITRSCSNWVRNASAMRTPSLRRCVPESRCINTRVVSNVSVELTGSNPPSTNKETTPSNETVVHPIERHSAVIEHRRLARAKQISCSDATTKPVSKKSSDTRRGEIVLACTLTKCSRSTRFSTTS